MAGVAKDENWVAVTARVRCETEGTLLMPLKAMLVRVPGCRCDSCRGAASEDGRGGPRAQARARVVERFAKGQESAVEATQDVLGLAVGVVEANDDASQGCSGGSVEAGGWGLAEALMLLLPSDR